MVKKVDTNDRRPINFAEFLEKMGLDRRAIRSDRRPFLRNPVSDIAEDLYVV